MSAAATTSHRHCEVCEICFAQKARKKFDGGKFEHSLSLVNLRKHFDYSNRHQHVADTYFYLGWSDLVRSALGVTDGAGCVRRSKQKPKNTKATYVPKATRTYPLSGASGDHPNTFDLDEVASWRFRAMVEAKVSKLFPPDFGFRAVRRSMKLRAKDVRRNVTICGHSPPAK
jgi:hypothetical protein